MKILTYREQIKKDWDDIEDAVKYLRDVTIPDPQDERNKIADALEGIYNRLKSIESICDARADDDE